MKNGYTLQAKPKHLDFANTLKKNMTKKEAEKKGRKRGGEGEWMTYNVKFLFWIRKHNVEVMLSDTYERS